MKNLEGIVGTLKSAASMSLVTAVLAFGYLPGCNQQEPPKGKSPQGHEQVQKQRALDYAMKGVEYFQRQLYKEAIEYTEKAHDLDPKNTETLSNLGAFYAVIKDPASSLKAYQEGLEIAPDHVGLNINICLFYLRCNLDNDAFAHYLKFRDVDFANLSELSARGEDEDARKYVATTLGKRFLEVVDYSIGGRDPKIALEVMKKMLQVERKDIKFFGVESRLERILTLDPSNKEAKELLRQRKAKN